jgi:hypothetical protein
MKKQNHADRKSFAKWAMPNQRTQSKRVPIHHTNHTRSIPARYPSTQIAFGLSRSIDARALNRVNKYAPGGKLTVRGVSREECFRGGDGAIRRNEPKPAGGKSGARTHKAQRRADREFDAKLGKRTVH